MVMREAHSAPAKLEPAGHRMIRVSLFLPTVALVVLVSILPVSAQSTFDTLYSAKEQGRKATLEQCHADLIAWEKERVETEKDDSDLTLESTFSTEELYRRSGEASTCRSLLLKEAAKVKDLRKKVEAEQRVTDMMVFFAEIKVELLYRAEGVMIDHNLGQEFLLKTGKR